MTEPTMKRAMGDGIEIQLCEWPGDGRTVLCIHGLTANCRCWDGIAGSLSPRHRFLAVDLRGRGLSDQPPTGYSIEHHCRDLRNLLDELQLERPVLMGHSLGAYIALAFASRYPAHTDRIILVDGGGKLSQEQMKKVREAINPALQRLGQVFPSFEDYVGALKQAPPLQPWNDTLEAYFRYETEKADGGIHSRVRPGAIQEELDNLDQVDPSVFYPHIACPALILRATEGMLAPDDLLLPEEAVVQMLAEMPNAQRVDLKGTNHYSIIFHPNASRDQTLLAFLEKH